LSGLHLSNNSPLIEEVQKNNFVKVSRIMDQFMLQKNTTTTLTGRQTQQRNRNIKNTF